MVSPIQSIHLLTNPPIDFKQSTTSLFSGYFLGLWNGQWQQVVGDKANIALWLFASRAVK